MGNNTSPAFNVGSDDLGKVRVLTLDRPDKLNAFTADGYRLLTRQLELAAADDGVSVGILTGRGRAFSSGADLAELGRPGGQAELGANFDPLLDALVGFPKPLLAAVNGLALGFGATILLLCDAVVVDQSADITFPFARLGTCVEAAGSWLLPLRVGMQQASWMVLSSRPVNAEQAMATGLAMATALPGHALDHTLEMASTIAEHPLPALMANKRLLRAGWAEAVTQAWDRERSAMLEDGQHGRSHRLAYCPMIMTGVRSSSWRPCRCAPGRPSTRSATMSFMISVVPPSIGKARLHRNACCGWPNLPGNSGRRMAYPLG